jgi:DNA-binding GntR family transcriptional regulator
MSVFERDQPVPLGEKTSAAAARIIRSAVLDGRLAPGQPLRESEMAHDLGISRTPIREALLLLENEGLVAIAPNRGAAVVRYDGADLEDLYTLRAVLEAHAARMAATRITPRELEFLGQSCERCSTLRRGEERVPELLNENLEFHMIIQRAAGSQRLIDMIRRVATLPLIYRTYISHSDDYRERAERAHREITEALAKGDAQTAGSVMEAHILYAGAWAVDALTAPSSDAAAPDAAD